MKISEPGKLNRYVAEPFIFTEDEIAKAMLSGLAYNLTEAQEAEREDWDEYLNPSDGPPSQKLVEFVKSMMTDEMYQKYVDLDADIMQYEQGEGAALNDLDDIVIEILDAQQIRGILDFINHELA